MRSPVIASVCMVLALLFSATSPTEAKAQSKTIIFLYFPQLSLIPTVRVAE